MDKKRQNIADQIKAHRKPRAGRDFSKEERKVNTSHVVAMLKKVGLRAPYAITKVKLVLLLLGKYVSPTDFSPRVLLYKPLWKAIPGIVKPTGPKLKNGYHYYQVLTKYTVALRFYVKTKHWAPEVISLGPGGDNIQISYVGFEDTDELQLSEFKREAKGEKKQYWENLQSKFNSALRDIEGLPPLIREVSNKEKKNIKVFNGLRIPFEIVFIPGPKGPVKVCVTRRVYASEFNGLQLQYTGPIVTEAEVIENMDKGNGQFHMRIAPNKHVDAHPIKFRGKVDKNFLCRYINHSSENANVKAWLENGAIYIRMEGKEFLEQGTELLLDYGDEYNFDGKEIENDAEEVTEKRRKRHKRRKRRNDSRGGGKKETNKKKTR